MDLNKDKIDNVAKENKLLKDQPTCPKCGLTRQMVLIDWYDDGKGRIERKWECERCKETVTDHIPPPKKRGT